MWLLNTYKLVIAIKLINSVKSNRNTINFPIMISTPTAILAVVSVASHVSALGAATISSQSKGPGKNWRR